MFFYFSNPESVNPCELAQMSVGICQTYWISQVLYCLYRMYCTVLLLYCITQVVFSLFFLVWNLLVAVVLVSVARTQVSTAQRAFEAQIAGLFVYSGRAVKKMEIKVET